MSFAMQGEVPPVGDGSEASQVRLSSEEINILIYLYLLESNFNHTAFTLLSESSLPSSPIFQSFNPSFPTPSSSDARTAGHAPRTNGSSKNGGNQTTTFGSSEGKIARGELIRKLWKALRWEEIERHATNDGEQLSSSCRSPFHLLLPHVCSSDGGDSSERITASPPPKRPEAFPPPAKSVEDPYLPGNKGKRKTRDSGPGLPVEQVTSAATGVNEAGSGDGHGVESVERSAGSTMGDEDGQQHSGMITKRFKEEKTRDGKKGARPPVSASGIKLRPLTENSALFSSGSWSEHRDAVTCLAWNPKDRDVLVTGSSDGTAKLWDFEEPAPGSTDQALRLGRKPASIAHKSIDSGKKAITALVWHPDGTVFATASDGVGRLFTPSGQLQGILTYGRGAINALKFNPSGTSLLAAKDDFTVCLFVLDFDLKSPKQLSFEAHTKEVNDVDWLDDDVFASGGNDHTIFIYRANDRRPRFTLKGHTDDVTRVKWSPPLAADKKGGSRLLASVADDGCIMIWKLPQYPVDRGTVSRSQSPNKQSKERELPDDIFQLTVAPGSEYCVNRLHVVENAIDNKRMNTLEWSPTSRDGRMIVAAGGQDSTVKLFDALSGECLHVLGGLEAGTGSIAFSPLAPARPQGIIAGGGWNGKLLLWDIATGKILQDFEVHEELDRQSARDKPMMMAMAWRNDGQQLALGLHNKALLTLSVGQLL